MLCQFSLSAREKSIVEKRECFSFILRETVELGSKVNIINEVIPGNQYNINRNRDQAISQIIKRHGQTKSNC